MNKKIIAILSAALLFASAIPTFCTADEVNSTTEAVSGAFSPVDIGLPPDGEGAPKSPVNTVTVAADGSDTENPDVAKDESADSAATSESTDNADASGVTYPLTDKSDAEASFTAPQLDVTGRKYEIPELEMSLTIPSRYFVVCTSTTQAELDASGLEDISVSLWIENLLEGNAYLEGVDFSQAGGGIFAQSSPEASPDSTLYVSFYPYEETEESFAYSEKDSRLDWITKFYLESDTSLALAQNGIFYSDMGRRNVNGREWQMLKYEAGETLGISYVTPYNGGELSVMLYLPANTAQTQQYEAELAEIMESVSLKDAKTVNYTPIIVVVSLAVAVALLIFLAKKK